MGESAAASSNTRHYESLYDNLCERIVFGELNPCEPVPGDFHLSREFGLSVHEAKQALDQLAKEGILVRVMGRATAVSPEALSRLLGKTLPSYQPNDDQDIAVDSEADGSDSLHHRACIDGM